MKKILNVIVYIVLPLVIFFLIISGTAKTIVYAVVGSTVKDFAVYGWSDATPAMMKDVIPSLEKVEVFPSKEQFDAYLSQTYKPSQKVKFNCLDGNGNGGVYVSMTISEVYKQDCPYGYMAIYKFP